MPDTADSGTALDPNFRETIALLDQNNIPYWVCHGTLLGLIRDGELIPWDHDIDIAIWADQCPKPLAIRIMTDAGYKLIHDGADFDFLHFEKGNGRHVDFNFYRISEQTVLAFSEWFIPRSRACSILGRIADPDAYAGKYRWVLRRLGFASGIASRIVEYLKQRGLYYRSAGYTTPLALLQDFKHIKVADLEVRVPVRSEEVLSFVYGNDWRVPRQVYDWVAESPSTRVSNSRFK